MDDFGGIYLSQGKYIQAEALLTPALAGRRHALGAESPYTMESAADLSTAYLSQRKFALGEPLAREALARGRKTQPEGWQTFRAESLVGAILAGEKNYVEAEPLLLEGYKGMESRRAKIGAPHRLYLDLARQWLVQLYADWGKPDQSAEWKKK